MHSDCWLLIQLCFGQVYLANVCLSFFSGDYNRLSLAVYLLALCKFKFCYVTFSSLCVTFTVRITICCGFEIFSNY